MGGPQSSPSQTSEPGASPNVTGPTQQQSLPSNLRDNDSVNTLYIERGSLSINECYMRIDTPKDKRESWLFAASSVSRNCIALYDILWAEIIDNGLTIKHVIKSSNDRLEPRIQRFLLSHDSGPTRAAFAWVEILLSKAYESSQPRRRAYVLINPHAGRRQASSIWEHDVKPIFYAAHWNVTVQYTEGKGHAAELAEELDIQAYDAVVTCSGDGIPHEVFNGLARRPDASYVLSKIAVAHVPCGGGNALALNLYGTNKPTLAALAILKGERTPLDLISITQGGKRSVSFLSQALGVIAEIGRATEHLRWMGESRLTYGYLRRVLARKVYPCDIAIKIEMQDKKQMLEHHLLEKKKNEDVDGNTKANATTGSGCRSLRPLTYGTVDDPIPEDWEVIKYDNMGNFYAGNLAYMAPGKKFFNVASPNDGLLDVVTIDGDISPLASINFINEVERGSLIDSPLVTYRKVAAYRITPRDQHVGDVVIDGERFPFEPFQAEVHQGLGTVLSMHVPSSASVATSQ